MRLIQWILVLAASAVVVGCTGGGFTSSNPAGAGGASPVENYKEARMREALRGLDYSSGLVTLSPEAREIAAEGTLADGARLAAEADAVMQTNDFPAAIAAYTKAVIVAPNRAATYLSLAQALQPKGRSTEAEAAIRTAIRLEPKSLDANLALARLIDTRGDSAATVSAWQAVLALDSKVAEAHGRIAIATYYQGDTAGAAKHIDACEKLGGNVPSQFKDMVVAEARSAKP